jgi:uncharacterized Zn finger protein (UPF0148 family)
MSIVSRCRICGQALIAYQGERFCPFCTSYTLPDEMPEDWPEQDGEQQQEAQEQD